jgi:hypothetical protein
MASSQKLPENNLMPHEHFFHNTVQLSVGQLHGGIHVDQEKE